MKITENEYRAYVRKVQFEEQQRKIEEALQEDFKVFISYSHADEKTARRVTALLDELDMKNYVIDRKELNWGDDIRDFAVQQIDQCTHYLLIVSEASSQSKWCALEFGIAIGANKKILLFLTNDAVQIPAYAANILATANTDVLKGFFSRDLIRPEVVEKFIAEIIDDDEAALDEFNRADFQENRCIRWDAPDRAAIESKKRDIISAYIDDYRAEDFWRLLSIEMRQPFEEPAVVLHYSCPGWRPRHYELSYHPELKGIVVTPEKEHSLMMGVRLTDDDGTDYFVNKKPSFEEQLASRGVHGWPASPSFWVKAFNALKNKLLA